MGRTGDGMSAYASGAVLVDRGGFNPDEEGDGGERDGELERGGVGAEGGGE